MNDPDVAGRESLTPSKDGAERRSEGIISAVIEHWRDSPDSALSVRSLTASAGTAASAIGYHFGGLEQLFVAASRRMLAPAKLWMERVLRDILPLGGRPVPIQVSASIIAVTIDQWIGERSLAMAWRRTKSLSPTPDALVVQLAWDEAWIDFWARIGECLGMTVHARTLAAFADGEACRHLLSWKPVLDKCLLQETALALTSWLDTNRIAGDSCRMAYRAGLTSDFAKLNDDREIQFSLFGNAAADLLARKGRSGVTFRAVAMEANSTLGAVSHHFGNKSNLLREALYRLYERETMTGDRGALFKREIPPSIMLDQIITGIVTDNHPILAAYDEIELAIYNDPDFIDLGTAARCLDDPSGTWALKNLLGGQQPSQSLVAAFSSVCRGAGHLIATGARHADNSDAFVRSALSPFCVN
ncbi:helix-turn-helix domain-containing protein [Tsuneonella suprasediminis]|uniref:helix-turn-helix domain-containing protein n=1 Tax=Tsuneonella suprasediminis TaxID=2306996 RepID=UPI0010586B21|nr:helix-turn-helix domain-containing protein [Tsuneonella suprasediminis]